VSQELESKISNLVKNLDPDTFIFDLLFAYDFPKSTIARIKNGDLNLSKNPKEILLKGKLLFKVVSEKEDLHHEIDLLSSNKAQDKNNPRFIIVTDFKALLALDTKKRDTLDISIDELSRHFDFFFPWIGKEKTQLMNENLVDIKAANKMGQLYDLLLNDNPNFLNSEKNRHYLNIFFARLLFCLFSEDTGIFEEGLFVNSIASHTKEDGSDLQEFFNTLFLVLNSKENSKYSSYFKKFPYVNGGLFADQISIPLFSRKSRGNIIEAGLLDWAIINPDIFGSMVQAISDPNERSNLGIHYTSVSNILKIINPLFMDELHESFKSYKTEKDLEKILSRIYKFKIFDPACGSGNFLIVTYKELCNLEIKIYEELQKLNSHKWAISNSGLRLNQLYGITIKDFDVEIAKLSLWLTEHQMNLLFKDIFKCSRPTLPLTSLVNIHKENSLRVNWDSICSKDIESEIFVIGNPPYLGSSMQTNEQKTDLDTVFKGSDNYRNLDYISGWFVQAAKYIQGTNNQCAFISTNSICQGEQVAMLWPHILSKNVEISFCHSSFKWKNNAKANAAVIVVIVGLRNKSNSKKYIFQDGTRHIVNNINPYLLDARNLIISSRSSPLSSIPKMSYGCKFTDGGNLILSDNEKAEFLNKFPKAEKFVRKLIGSEEFINGKTRWCLFIRDSDLEEALGYEFIRNRIAKVKLMRLASKAASTRDRANSAHKYESSTYTETNAIIIPRVSSERREYVPMGFLNPDTVIVDSAQAIYQAKPWILSVLTSKMHMIWMRVVAGRLKTDYRYSSAIVYNTFPFPKINDNQKQILNNCAFQIINAREMYSERTLAELYDPDKMPIELALAHSKNDLEVDKCYTFKDSMSDDDRLKILFDLFQDMTKNEEAKCLI